MTAAQRERLVVDLRDLGPKLKAHAASRGLTVSEVTRRALAAHFELGEPDAGAPSTQTESRVEPRSVKVSIRMRSQVATALSVAAQESGVSQGVYVGRLLDARPAPPVAVTAALSRSTDQLAVTLTDLNEVIRILARGGVSSSAAVDGWLKPLAVDLRAHVDVAARLLAELRSPGLSTVPVAADKDREGVRA